MAGRASLALVRSHGLRPSVGSSAGRRRLLGYALAVLAAAALLYAGARETSAFAFRSVELAGAKGAVSKDVRKALRTLEGESLVALDPAAIEDLLRSVPTVRDATVDRAFPHTLAVSVEPERPLVVLEDGKRAWLVAESGRVIAAHEPGARPSLPRLVADVPEPPAVGGTLDGVRMAETLAALAAVPRRFPGVAAAEGGESGLVLTLENGLEVRLGEPVDAEAKLAAAAAVIKALSADELALYTYVDASVSARVVAGSENEPSSESLEFVDELPAN